MMDSSQQFLNGRVTLHAGDCREMIKAIPSSSIDSVVCDPPYALVSIVRRFGKPGSAEAKGGVYQRSAAGFMGKQWDNGEAAFAETFWAEVLRVLKPGGHVLAFSGTRTYHRLAVAIEDAGFEIRDQIGWAYGSGFPKSHDVSKGIDKAAPRRGMFNDFALHYGARRKSAGLTHNAICAAGGFFAEHNHGGASTNWEKGNNVPTMAQWEVLQPLLGLSDEWLPLIERAEAEREKIGERKSGDPVAWYGETGRGDGLVDITIPATDAAREWQGWGTALKPAWEPIVMARKPLAGTVAANVLEHGTGAINIDGARIHSEDAPGGEYTVKRLKPGATLDKTGGNWRPEEGGIEYRGTMKPGRWPANIIHDGSTEVLDAFPYTDGGGGPAVGTARSKLNTYGDPTVSMTEPKGANSGSSARFFYSAKADADDRLGSKHPTVKPLDLMQYLVRLVTPLGGIVLDPFAGTGTTGEAAFREGMRAVLIEREPEYQADIARRMDLAQNPTKRAAVAKSKNNLQGAEGTPLFDGDAA